MTSKIQKNLRNKRKNQFFNKSFQDYRNDLLNYANTYYSNNISDFSEASLGGMLLDFAAIVGDSLSFYAEQQFNELNYETANNPENIRKHLKRAGIKEGFPTPSAVFVDFFLEVDVDNSSGSNEVKPLLSDLPVIKKETILGSSEGINFVLEEDVDFTKNYKFEEVSQFDGSENPSKVIISKKGICISGNITNERVIFGSNPENEFFAATLENNNITKILSVIDDQLNEYFEVDFLSQNTVFKRESFNGEDYVEIVPAIYKFVREEDFNSLTTTIRFGNGNGKSLESDILENPEDILLPLLGRDYTVSTSLDPNDLLKSNSLGVSPASRTVNIKYKYGGGLDHNLPEGSIDNIIEINYSFPNMASLTATNIIKQKNIIENMGVLNREESIGGSDGSTLEELKNIIPSAMKSQNRIITHEDLISRIYTLPSNFGKVHKVAALENNFTGTSKDLFVVCKNSEGFYSSANDALKINLSNYLNEFRLIGDNFNIIDCPIFNFGINIIVKIRSGFLAENVFDDIKSRIIANMNFEKLNIGEPINTNDIVNICLNTQGVVNVVSPLQEIIVSKTEKDSFIDPDSDALLSYNNNFFNPLENFESGLVYPKRGGIFEIRYNNNDINISAS